MYVQQLTEIKKEKSSEDLSAKMVVYDGLRQATIMAININLLIYFHHTELEYFNP